MSLLLGILGFTLAAISGAEDAALMWGRERVRPTSFGADVEKVVAGDSHILVLKKDHTVWAAGDNSHGQLGLSDDVKDVPINELRKVPIDGKAIEIAAGAKQSFIIRQRVPCTYAHGMKYATPLPPPAPSRPLSLVRTCGP